MLLDAKPARTSDAPCDRRGLYGLIDHAGDLRYVGSTNSKSQTLYKRIHCRHRSGSEDRSHYFSRMYNTGRMWRDRHTQKGHPDAEVSKRLRNAFIVDHCRAVWVVLDDECDIFALEAAILKIAPSWAVAWNRLGASVYVEPTELVDWTIGRLGLTYAELAALERQRERHCAISKGNARVI